MSEPKREPTPVACRLVRAALRLAGVAGLAPAVFLACGAAPAPRAADVRGPRNPDCRVDQVREFLCDDLLPLGSALPAPSPYENCPETLAGPVGQFEPAPPFAAFDRSYTEYTRKRAPPGHACCYSWCSALTLANPASPDVQARCVSARAFREEYCMAEPEAGTMLSPGEPFARCPLAIVPPARAVFSVPPAALLDAQLTATRRGKGEPQCCYAWCSEAPAGSGLRK